MSISNTTESSRTLIGLLAALPLTALLVAATYSAVALV